MLRASRFVALGLALGTLSSPGANAQTARDGGTLPSDLRAIPHHSVITHPPGNVGANVGQAYFDVTNRSAQPRTLSAVSAQFVQQRSLDAPPVTRTLRLLGLAFGFATGTPHRTVTLAAGQSAILAVHFAPVTVHQRGTDTFVVRARLAADGAPFEIETAIEVQQTTPVH